MQGWIKLHRQIKENWVYSSKPFCKFGAWVDLLLSANHDKAKFNIGTSLVDIEKGQFITSEIKLSERWGWTRKTVRNFLKLLEADGMITKKSTTKYTSITIMNWSLYQSEEQQKNNKGTTKEQQRDTNKNDKNEENENITAEENFEKLWSLYPRRIQKGKVTDEQKQKILKIPYDEMVRAINRYKDKLKKDNTPEQYIQMGFTFFTTGYLDYLDCEYGNPLPKNVTPFKPNFIEREFGQ